MKRDFWALWALLAVAFLVLLTVSLCSRDTLSVGPVKIKSSSLGDVLRTDSDAVDTVAAPSLPLVEEEPERTVLDDSPKTVLLIGDSMIEGLAPRLAAYCQATGNSLYAVIWYSSTTELYGQSRLISDYINVLHPDYIFLSLGGNELFVNDIAEKRQGYVQSILDEIGNIPYVWIGPPNWKADTGINDLIAANVKPGCFFLTNGMHFDRKRDGAHPTAESSVVWMDSIARWIPDHARYVLPLNQPDTKTARPVKYYLHQPGSLTERPR